MSVGADVLNLGPAELEHAAPRSGLDGHAQAAQADPATVALVPNGSVEHTAAEQEPESDDECKAQVVPETRGVDIGELLRRRPEALEGREHRIRQPEDGQQLACQKGPVAHILFDSRRGTKVPSIRVRNARGS